MSVSAIQNIVDKTAKKKISTEVDTNISVAAYWTKTVREMSTNVDVPGGRITS